MRGTKADRLLRDRKSGFRIAQVKYDN